MGSIFVSYSSKDEKVAKRICTALETKGLACWIASRDVNPGENFGEAIVNAIRNAKVMLLVFTQNANNSDEIKKELVLAGHNRLIVIPVRVEDIEPGGAFAYELATRQWIDLFDDWDREMDRLGAWIQKTLEVADAAPPTPASPTKAKAGRQVAQTLAPDLDKELHSEPATSLDEASLPPRRGPPPPPVSTQPAEAVAADRAAPNASFSERAEVRRPPVQPSPPIRPLPVDPVLKQEAVGGLSRRRMLRMGVAAAGIAAIGGGVALELQPGYRLWRLLYDKSVRTYEGHTGTVFSVAVAPDGRTVLSGSNDETLGLWDVSTGQRLRTFRGHHDRVTTVAISPDGRMALSGSADKTILAWDLAAGQQIREFDGEIGYVRSVAISPDGRTALSGEEGGVKLWDIGTGKQIRMFAGHMRYVELVAYSPDGRSALSGSDDQSVKLWDVATGRNVATFTGHSDWVTSVAFSPNGRLAASASHDYTVKLWDLNSRRDLQTLSANSEYVFSVAFTPDGRTLLSGHADDMVRVWDLGTGRVTQTLVGHSGTVPSVASSPDGRFAFSGSSDYTLKLWRLAA